MMSSGKDGESQIKTSIQKEEADEDEVPCTVDGRNSVVGTALAIISTIMGGGIVSIPFAYAVAGPAVGLSVQIIVIIAIWISCILYLQTRNILRCNTTFSVIANLCLGPLSGIILNSLIVFAVFGILALYMILFSEIAISLIGGSFEDDHFLNHKTFYVLVLSVLISPIIVRKRIADLKFSTYVLFFGVLCLIVLLCANLAIKGTYETQLANGTTSQSAIEVVAASSNSAMEKVMDSVNIAVASQGFVIALFPIYSSMARDARPRVMTSVTGALMFTMCTYTLLSMVSISYYGQDNIQPSIFNNIQAESGFASIALRFLFLMIFFCNIPFVFFAGKIALLAVVHQCCFAKKPEQREDIDDDDTYFERVET